MVGRPACCRCRCALEAQSLQVELVDERVDDAYRVVFTDVVVETLRKQGDLASVLSLDESLHVRARSVALTSILPSSLTRAKRFHTVSVDCGYFFPRSRRPKPVVRELPTE